jgi:hypothetical protein
MSKPFMIWTMQRTGGTALTELLMQMSEHRPTEHEPFNWARKNPRQFWPVADAWNKTKDAQALAGSLDAIFAQNYLIKHCYELLSVSFNEQLMLALAKTYYRHILLLRRDEAGRLFSKFIAEAQGTWFRDYARRVFADIADGQRALDPLPVDEIVAHYKHCRRMTELVVGWLSELGPECKRIYYEDLYTGGRRQREKNLHELFDFLGFTTADVARYENIIAAKIFHGGQDTKSIAGFVPNLKMVMTALEGAGYGAADVGEAARKAPVKPAMRIATELRKFVELHDTRGPYLEIGVSPGRPRVLVGPSFENQEVHTLGPKPLPHANGMKCHLGQPDDMRALFPDGRFATVVWNDALAHEPRFWFALEELWRVLAGGGILVLAAPGFSRAADRAGVMVASPRGNAIPDTTPTYRIHASPDYWRFSPQAMTNVLLAGYEVRQVKVSSMPPRIFGIGIKPICGKPLKAIDMAGAMEE